MIIISSLVKITTTLTRPDEYIHTKEFLFGQTLVYLDFRHASLVIYPGDHYKFPAWHMYHHTHTYSQSLIQPHAIIRKYNLHKNTHTLTKKELYTILTKMFF